MRIIKTISELSREIGVSKQAIHKKLKQEPFKTKLDGLTTMVDNSLRVTVDGEILIKSMFSKSLTTEIDEPSTKVDGLSTKVDGLSTEIDGLSTEIDEETEIIKVLKRQINLLIIQNEDLRRQLDEERVHSREQADRILNLAELGNEIAKNAQTLQAYESSKQPTQQIEAKDKSKKNIFNIFKKKK